MRYGASGPILHVQLAVGDGTQHALEVFERRKVHEEPPPDGSVASRRWIGLVNFDPRLAGRKVPLFPTPRSGNGNSPPWATSTGTEHTTFCRFSRMGCCGS